MNFPVFCLQESINTKMANWQKAVVNGFLLCYLQGFFVGGGGVETTPMAQVKKVMAKHTWLLWPLLLLRHNHCTILHLKKAVFSPKERGHPLPLDLSPMKPLPWQKPGYVPGPHIALVITQLIAIYQFFSEKLFHSFATCSQPYEKWEKKDLRSVLK